MDLHTRCNTDRFEAGEKEVSDIKEITRKKITLGQINNANGNEYELNHNGARFNIFEHESGEVDVLLGNYRWSDVLNNDTVEVKEIVENKESIISHTNAIGNDNQVNIVLTGTNITTGETVLNIHAEEQKLNATGKSNITEEYRPALPGQSTGEVRNPKAFAVLLEDGSVATWGTVDSIENREELKSGVVELFSNTYAFAALKEDGSVVTWGWGNGGGNSFGGDSSEVANQLTSGVKQIYSNDYTFTALKEDGSVVTWGASPKEIIDWKEPDEDKPDTSSITGIKEIVTNRHSFAGLRDDGSVVEWGEEPKWKPATNALSSGVKQIYATKYSFAALKDDGSIVAWGESSGGDTRGYEDQLSAKEFVEITPNGYAYAALKKDGSVLTWGESRYGIDMYNNNTNNIQESLSSGVLRVYSTDTGFAALKDDKTVVFWGQYGDFEDIADGKLSDIAEVYTDGGFVCITEDGEAIALSKNGLSRNMGYDSSIGSNKYVDISDQLKGGVKKVFGTDYASAALMDDGSVVTWGDYRYGGAVSPNEHLESGVVDIITTNGAFAALKDDGTLVTWGSTSFGALSGGVDVIDYGKQVVGFADPSNRRTTSPITNLNGGVQETLPYTKDISSSLKDITTARGNEQSGTITDINTMWLNVGANGPTSTNQDVKDKSAHGFFITGNSGETDAPKKADPIFGLVLKEEGTTEWKTITPMIWNDEQEYGETGYGVIDDEELSPTGIYKGDVHLFDADGRNKVDQTTEDGSDIDANDLALTGFSTATRRDATGQNLAIPQTNIYLYAGTAAEHSITNIDGKTPIYKDTGIELYGVANGTIDSGDIDGDGDIDLLLTGEDFFALPADENTQADGQGGGNPITMIYRNNRLEPTQDGNVQFTGDITFENALFVPNSNDPRWAQI